MYMTFDNVKLNTCTIGLQVIPDRAKGGAMEESREVNPGEAPTSLHSEMLKYPVTLYTGCGLLVLL